MTPQEVFDFTTRKIIEQGGPSYMPRKKECRYRHPKNNRRCAIGWVIPDNKYRRSIEGFDAFDALGKLDLSEGWRAKLGGRISLLIALQSAHDWAAETSSEKRNRTAFWSEWSFYLRQAAKRFDLNDTVLKEIPK